MNAIYPPKGKALEYGELAVSLYRKCGHGCVECYVPEMFRMSYTDFNDHPHLRPGIMEKLEKDARQLGAQKDQREIVMSFTTDPYLPIQDTTPTRHAMALFIQNGLRFTVLTKAGMRSTRDFDLMAAYREKCRYGASLTLHDAPLSLKYEPAAAVPEDRVLALRAAKLAGITTWASCEPVLFPAQTLRIMAEAAPHVDEFRIGAVNHVGAIVARMPEYVPPTFDEMVDFVQHASALLERVGRPVKWKDSMAHYLAAAGVQ